MFVARVAARTQQQSPAAKRYKLDDRGHERECEIGRRVCAAICLFRQSIRKMQMQATPQLARCQRAHTHTHTVDHTPDVIIWLQHKIDVELFGSIEFESIHSLLLLYVWYITLCAALAPVLDARRSAGPFNE